MQQHADRQLVARLNRIAASVAALAVAVGASVLVGWALHIATLKSWFEGGISVRATAALCFLLLGCSLWELRKPSVPSTARYWPQLAKLAAAVVMLIGCLALLENLFGWQLGIDEVLFQVRPGDEIGSVRPGLIPLLAALDFMLLGAALLALDWKTSTGLWPSQSLVLVALVLDLISLLDFLPTGGATHTHVALPGATVFFIVPLGIFAARPEWAFGGLLISNSPGARLLRKAIPGALLALMLIGLSISKALLTEAHFNWLEVTSLALISMFLLIALITWNAHLLDTVDQQRIRAGASLPIAGASAARRRYVRRDCTKAHGCSWCRFCHLRRVRGGVFLF